MKTLRHLTLGALLCLAAATTWAQDNVVYRFDNACLLMEQQGGR